MRRDVANAENFYYMSIIGVGSFKDVRRFLRMVTNGVNHEIEIDVDDDAIFDVCVHYFLLAVEKMFFYYKKILEENDGKVDAPIPVFFDDDTGLISFIASCFNEWRVIHPDRFKKFRLEYINTLKVIERLNKKRNPLTGKTCTRFIRSDVQDMVIDGDFVSSSLLLNNCTRKMLFLVGGDRRPIFELLCAIKIRRLSGRSAMRKLPEDLARLLIGFLG